MFKFKPANKEPNAPKSPTIHVSVSGVAHVDPVELFRFIEAKERAGELKHLLSKDVVGGSR